VRGKADAEKEEKKEEKLQGFLIDPRGRVC
jgi:hypothetical protein